MTIAQQKTTKYTVVAERSEQWWAISVPGLDGAYGQAKRIDQIEAAARKIISLYTNTAETEIGELEIDIRLSSESDAALSACLEAVCRAIDAEAQAHETRRIAAQTLQTSGLSMRDIGKLLNLSFQRVSQILAD